MSCKQHKILVTDDDADLRHVIGRFLEIADYEYYEAANGRECVAQLREHDDIGLVILDVVMPDQEGLETLSIIKKEFPELKLLMISGGGRTSPLDYLSIAKSLGANETLSKPFRSEKLIGMVRNLLSS
ncbi:MAG: response regulator [Proteobacteria bacterium]|nr:response regulator [Pseudomonadota bacterium]